MGAKEGDATMTKEEIDAAMSKASEALGAPLGAGAITLPEAREL